MSRGYCTSDDVRRVLQEAEFTGALGSDDRIIADAIEGQSDALEKKTKRHWFDADASPSGFIPSEPRERDDEESIPTPAAAVVSEQVSPRISHVVGDRQYTRIRFARRYVTDLQVLEVLDDTGYTDWVASSEYVEGRGEDYYVQVNNSGKSELYLDVSNLYNERDDEWLLDRWANTVYVEFAYGDDELPNSVRRATAMLAAHELVIDDDADISIPDSGQLVSVETKAQQFKDRANELLEPYLMGNSA